MSWDFLKRCTFNLKLFHSIKNCYVALIKICPGVVGNLMLLQYFNRKYYGCNL